MTISKTQNDGKNTLALEGRVDTATAPQLIGQKTAKTKGGSMTLCCASKEGVEVFETTGFAKMLKIV